MQFLMKYWFNIRHNIFQTIQPICRTMKWFGFMPFTLVSHPHAQPHPPREGAQSHPTAACLEVKTTDALLLAGWQLYILHWFFTDWLDDLHEMPMSKIMIYFSISIYFVEAALLCSVQLLVAFSKAKIEETLRLVKFTDDLLEQFAVGVNHRRQHLGSILLIFGSIICAGLIFVAEYTVGRQLEGPLTDVWSKYYTTATVCYYDAMRLIQVCPLVVFIGGLLMFKSRFRMLNYAFRSYFNRQRKNLNDEEVKTFLRFTAICHDTLTDAVTTFCDVFSFQVTSACTTFILVNIFSMYTIGALFSRHTPDVVYLSLFYGLANLLYALHIIPIIKLGSDVRDEGTRMAVLVHKAINQSTLSDRSIDRLRLFSRQLQQQTPNVSGGMFSFDWTLCFSIFSATATYVVIMVEFELDVPQFFIDSLKPSTGNLTSRGLILNDTH
ncbi:putative gustatory receptor 28a [Topomyia yanbarensis]|uniref:putative gustatory receptor 28a n=1 Tax=Topomyia yanbarensis TaxID=2498891 RepID=UPI00273C7582|nr:putative gustatory receptor 28a [Topomyia yanbarensis]